MKRLMQRTGTQCSAVVEAMDTGSGRFDRVAARQDRRLLIQRPWHLAVVITTVVTDVSRHGDSNFRWRSAGQRGDMVTKWT